MGKVEVVVWKGDEDATNALIKAVNRNCLQTEQQRPCDVTCAAHAIMRNQQMLDDLLFQRHIAQRLLSEEFDPAIPLRDH